MPSINPSNEQLQKFVVGAREGSPIVMINLLKYREQAQYPENSQAEACSGREAYARYAAGSNKKDRPA